MTDRLTAPETEVEFFLARTEEQDRFRKVLRSLVGPRWRRYRQHFPTMARLLPDRGDSDPHRDRPWIFLFYGEGGMGKSTLVRRLQAIAEGKLCREEPGDRAWMDRVTILTIDWEAERKNRSGLQGPRDQIPELAVLDALFKRVASIDGKAFGEYEGRLKDLEAANEKVSKKLQEEQQGGNADWASALAIVAKGALTLANRSDLVKDYDGQIDTMAAVTVKALPQVKTWLKTKLKREELEVFERPEQVLADALGQGLKRLTARKPLVMFLDTYEVVDRAECDGAMRLVMQAAGGRVCWVVSGRANLRNSGRRGEVYFKGYGDDFPEAKLYGKGLDEFGEAEIREYFERKVPDRAIAAAEVQAIKEFSLGIPFMVAEIASIWRDCPHLPLTEILAPAPVDETQTPRDRAIAAMTERFLFHCFQGGKDEATRTALDQDLAAIYSLAMVRRPDRQLLKAMLATEDLSAVLVRLEARYSFIRANDGLLHKYLQDYLLHYLLSAAQRDCPAVQGPNDRALAHLEARLAAKIEELPDLGDRLGSENARDLWLDAAHHRFWKAQEPDRDETAAWKFWLGAFVDAWLVDRAFAAQLVEVLEKFERCFSPDGRRRWGLLKGAWSEQRDFDCDRRKALLTELENLARRGWLETDAHPERAATLELEQARLLYGQKQYSAALQALAALDHRQTDPSLAFKKAMADLYNRLAVHFFLSEDQTRLVLSPQFLQAAERAYTLQPDNFSYAFTWGLALENAKKDEEAIAAYRQAITIDPNLAYAHNYLGNVYRNLKRYEEAITAYHQAISIDPNDAAPYNGLGNVYRDLNRYEEALTAYHQAISIDPNDAAPYNGLGNVYRDLNRYEEAVAACQQAITIDPNLAAPHNNLGNVYYDLKRYEEALTAYQQALSIDPNDSFPYNNLGNVYRELTRYEEALTAYQQAIAIDPNDSFPYNGLGNVYGDLNRYEEALTAYQQAIAIDPNDANPHNGLGNVYRALNRYEEAIAAYQQAIALDPNFALPHNNLGNVYFNLKRYEAAIATYQQSISLDPSSVYVHSNLGLALENLKHHSEAESAYRRALEIEGRAFDFSNLGRVLKAQGRYEGAIAAYQQAINLDPQNTSPYYDIGWLQFEQGDIAGAISTFQKAAEIDPTDKDLPTNLGFLYLISDRLDDASTYLLKSRELDPSDYTIAFDLAAVRALQSDLNSARSLLAESLQLCPKSTDRHHLYWAILSILLGNPAAGFEQLHRTLAALPDPTEMCVIRGGVLEATQAIARSPLASPDLHRAIDLLQTRLNQTAAP